MASRIQDCADQPFGAAPYDVAAVDRQALVDPRSPPVRLGQGIGNRRDDREHRRVRLTGRKQACAASSTSDLQSCKAAQACVGCYPGADSRRSDWSAAMARRRTGPESWVPRAVGMAWAVSQCPAGAYQPGRRDPGAITGCHWRRRVACAEVPLRWVIRPGADRWRVNDGRGRSLCLCRARDVARGLIAHVQRRMHHDVILG